MRGLLGFWKGHLAGGLETCTPNLSLVLTLMIIKIVHTCSVLVCARQDFKRFISMGRLKGLKH